MVGNRGLPDVNECRGDDRGVLRSTGNAVESAEKEYCSADSDEDRQNPDQSQNFHPETPRG